MFRFQKRFTSTIVHRRSVNQGPMFRSKEGEKLSFLLEPRAVFRGGVERPTPLYHFARARRDKSQRLPSRLTTSKPPNHPSSQFLFNNTPLASQPARQPASQGEQPLVSLSSL